MLGNVIWIGQSSLGQDGYVIEFGRAGDKCKRENDQMRETETGVLYRYAVSSNFTEKTARKWIIHDAGEVPSFCRRWHRESYVCKENLLRPGQLSKSSFKLLAIGPDS